MAFASLGSGSEGNALAVRCPGSERFVLVDCGFGVKALAQRAARHGLDLDQLAAILVTHEHGDHLGGTFRVASGLQLPVYLTHGTAEAARRRPGFDPKLCRLILPDVPFEVEGLECLPFPVPHDAREPVQFVLDDGAGGRLGLLTDIGHATPHVLEVLSNLTALVLECNHDRSLLQAGNYPDSLKRRVGGRFGHLENGTAAAILSSLDRSRLRSVVGAHLSRQNNRPDLARMALASVLDVRAEDIPLADQDEGSAWFGV